MFLGGDLGRLQGGGSILHQKAERLGEGSLKKENVSI